MTTPLSASQLIVEGWSRGFAAMVPNCGWLALFAVAGAAYSAALRLESSLAAPLITALLAFGAGIQVSRVLYASLMGPRAGTFLPLAHANSAVYLAFLFIGFFVAFFLLILPGILIEAQGRYDLGADASPELVQTAFLAMLPTAYGAVFLLMAVAGLGVLSFFALRLTLFGAATVAAGEAKVFQTFPWTRGHVLKLGLAALVTHVAPFAAGLAANAALQTVLPDTLAGHALQGAAGICLFAPFLLAGHGMAAAAHHALAPQAGAEPSVPD